LTVSRKRWYALVVPSHVLSSGPELRRRRRARRGRSRRRLRDWRTWVALLVLILAVSLSGGIADQIWPKAHGFGYAVTYIVVRGVLGGAIGVVLIAIASAIEVGIVRNRRRQQ
jgi:polyferredoxin